MRAVRWPSPPPPERIVRALPARGRFWLDGLAAHPEGRFCFLGADPIEVRSVAVGEGDPLSFLRDLDTGTPVEGLPIEVPSWVGFLGYDAAWAAPDRIGLRAAPRLGRAAMPLAWWGRYARLVVCDVARGETFVVAEDEARARAWMDALSRVAPPDEPPTVGPIVREDPARHRARIERALEAIARGDIYQVNLARPYTAAYEGDPLALFEAMRTASPVPLGLFLELPATRSRRAVLARTMERFLGWDRGSRRLWTSPIKGTIARSGHDDDRDAERLRRDEKERAEHSMIVDLMRNDLARVAEVGSVRVTAPLRVEPFAALSHLVSTVECTTREDVTIEAVLEATFPPGSITGTPKLRAMELIEALEDRARGVYCGAVGYVDRRGGLSLAVAIRTAVIDANEALYFAGGGLVSASDPDREIEETDLKARVFVAAIERLRDGNRD